MTTPYNRALDLLAGRAYSSRELHRKLVLKGVSSAEADAVVARLVENGVLDDQTFAVAFARAKLSGGASVRRVRQDLARKGVSGELAVAAIELLEEDQEVDVRANLERVARKKLAQMGDLELLVLRRRLYGFLARRGYEMDEIQAVVTEVLASSDDERGSDGSGL